MQEKYSTYKEITSDQIQDWKARHGDNLVEITITPKEEEAGTVARFVVIPPSRTVLNSLADFGIKKDVTNANKVLIANCVLGGDMEQLEQDGATYTAVMEELGKLMSNKQASIKKL